MRRSSSCALTLFLALCFASHARASDGFYDDPPDLPKTVTLTLSPIHVLIPMLEMQAEVRVGDFLGLSVIGGGGRLMAKNAAGKERHFGAYEYGGQIAFYPSSVFKGLQLGAEALWMHVDVADVIGTDRVTGLGAGLTLGPFIGYKWIEEPGFTVFVQGGCSITAIHTPAKNTLGQDATSKEPDLLLLLNFNVGWSL